MSRQLSDQRTQGGVAEWTPLVVTMAEKEIRNLCSSRNPWYMTEEFISVFVRAIYMQYGVMIIPANRKRKIDSQRRSCKSKF